MIDPFRTHNSPTPSGVGVILPVVLWYHLAFLSQQLSLSRLRLMLLQGQLIKGGGRLVSSARTHKAPPLPLVLPLQETVDGEHLSSKDLLFVRSDQILIKERILDDIEPRRDGPRRDRPRQHKPSRRALPSRLGDSGFGRWP